MKRTYSLALPNMNLLYTKAHGCPGFRPLLLISLFVSCTLVISGCATTKSTEQAERQPETYAPESGSNDPLEPINRAMFTFNDKFDRYLLKPVAKGYRAVTPAPVRTGVTNFFSNLRQPVVFLNDTLQGKFKDAGVDLGRFLTNSTLGIFGLFDVATRFGLEKHEEDLGQTFGVWGISEGPYLVLPFLGPSTVRDAVGLYGDLQAYPPTHMEEQSTAWKLYAVEAVDTRARLLEAGDIIEQAGGQDPYVFVREAYRQRRRALVKDGTGTEPSKLDPSIFEEDQPSQPSAEKPKKSPNPGS